MAAEACISTMWRRISLISFIKREVGYVSAVNLYTLSAILALNIVLYRSFGARLTNVAFRDGQTAVQLRS